MSLEEMQEESAAHPNPEPPVPVVPPEAHAVAREAMTQLVAALDADAYRDAMASAEKMRQHHAEQIERCTKSLREAMGHDVTEGATLFEIVQLIISQRDNARGEAADYRGRVISAASIMESQERQILDGEKEIADIRTKLLREQGLHQGAISAFRECHKDKVRMDWLSKQDGGIGQYAIENFRHYFGGSFPGVREVIDKALEAAQ